ncbi:transcriptional regulator [Marinitenerispora sediminis]|uniref:Transcriptional regulator n=1 Tax=Marinitenerispora sediminis TaxID=1931232 RepID=A0A368T1E4_9ACTN|nr:PucR family transcriptional regulator [Marinitenerispora sediminis]RCV50750.1 transcriptional regulator [Marinitenerispora sediminis]RCV54177.1 transcriptional regulator [Marinitenerispora sediminis]RCV56007.1 transcriptional regulator [Marinitenerispora sediminis]
MPLRRLLLAVGDPLLDVLAAPGGLDVRVDDVVILDPEDEGGPHAGDLVLLVGARGRAAGRLVRAAGRRGASAVAVKVGGPAEADVLRGVAGDAGVALLAVHPEARWEQLQWLFRSMVDDARLAVGGDPGEAPGDLSALAQTVATLTGGLVSIEDAASRVLAYSGGEDADELRRLSVLGRRGPEQYLALLREWGVFQRLRSGEEVVRVEEHPELGIRRRIAVGIHAGAQPLGAIWVQEGGTPLEPHAEEALLGAARIATLHLLRQRTEATAGLRLREDLLASLLEGRIEAAALADSVRADRDRPVMVVVFAMAAGESRTAGGRSEAELQRAQLTNLISVHAAAFRRRALVTTLGGRVYALLPDLARPAAEASVLALTRRIVGAARALLGGTVQGAVGSLVDTLGEVARSRTEADRVLDAMGRDLAMDVATISDVRSRVLVSETLAELRSNPRLRDPRVDLLVAHDAAHGSALVVSLVAYLEAFGDVRAAAARLHIHPNTLRYRVRRAEAVSGLDLRDPNERLFTHLQLLLARRL